MPAIVLGREWRYTPRQLAIVTPLKWDFTVTLVTAHQFIGSSVSGTRGHSAVIIREFSRVGVSRRSDKDELLL